MSKRVCAYPGCPAISDANICAEHRRQRDRQQPNSTERGYGAAHQRERARWEPVVTRGGAICARCNHPINPGEQWDMGHVDGDKTKYTGPEHARCNRATATHAQAIRLDAAVRRQELVTQRANARETRQPHRSPRPTRRKRARPNHRGIRATMFR